MELPHVDNCVIARATTEQFHHFRDILWPLWSKHKSHEESLALRKVEMEEAYSQDHRYQSWVLVDRNDTSQAYTYLETLRRDGWSKDSTGKIEEVPIYAIVSVITPEQYRRKGYSHRLLRQLHYILASPSDIGPWPSSWGPIPDLDDLKRHIPPAELTHLSSLAPAGFYENALIGPDEDARSGWVTRPEENVMPDWSIPSSSSAPSAALENTEDKEWGWTYVYSTEYDSLAPAIAQAHLRELEATEVKPAEKMFRIRPDSPGVLRFADLHVVFGMNTTRDMIPKDQPTGIRWFRRPSLSSTTSSTTAERAGAPPAFQSTDPLILFLDHSAAPDELLLQLALNVSPDFARIALAALVQHANQASPPAKKLKAFSPPLAFRDAVIQRGGKLLDRGEEVFIPHGTCYYGPKGTSGWLVDNQFWTWA